MCDNNIQNWVDSALQHQDIVNYEVKVEGQTDKGDGYGSDILFVKVSGYTKSGERKVLCLAIKSSKNSVKLAEQIPMKEIFLKEIYIYQDVKTAFCKLLQEKKVDASFRVIPECYGVHVTDSCQVLLLENLRPQNFELWDRTVVMTPKHVKLVLEAYGEWHGLSIALKAQKPEAFQKLTQNCTNMFSRIFVGLNMDAALINEFENVKKQIITENREDLATILQYSHDDIRYALGDMFFEDPDYNVILHGDCWNNNFLFKVTDDKTNPSEVRILDWQCSGLGSPVIDLSHFFYTCVDTSKYENVEDLLKIYYGSFSKTLLSVGCKPEEVFSFTKLLEHWKRFSRFGLFLSCLIVRLELMNVNEIPDFAETADKGEDITKNFQFGASNDQAFLQRVENNFVQYCRNSK